MKSETRARIRAALCMGWCTVDKLSDYLCLSRHTVRTHIIEIGRFELIFARRLKRKYQPKAYRILPRAVNIAAIVEKRKSKAA